MSSPENDYYIPYETTAIEVVRSYDTFEQQVRSVFEDATPKQIERVREIAAGWIHDGIILGLELSSEDPISLLEAYKLGAEENHF